MKMLKKLAALFMVGFMAVTTMSIASADTETGSITIEKEGTSYLAYQVLNSTSNDTTNSVIPVYSVNADFKNFFVGDYTFSADKGISFKGKVLENLTDEGLNDKKTNYNQNSEMEAFSVALIKYIDSNSITPVEITGKQAKDLAQGYYLIVENSTTITSSTSQGTVPSKAMMLPVIAGTSKTITPKEATVTINKTANGHTVGESTIGKEINYKIVSTIPTYASNFKDIKYNISDTLSNGLTYTPNTLNITVGGAEVLKDGVITNETFFKNGKAAFNGQSLAIEFNYDALLAAAKAGQEVVVTYTATLNEHATLTDPNTNTAILDYSNKPSGDTTGIPSTTETYTYGIKIKKVDGNTGTDQKALAGATFTLTKQNDTTFAPQTLTSDETGILTFEGLGNGIYTLTEVSAPNGYAVLKGAISIEITNKEGFKGAEFNVSGDKNVVTSTTTENGVLIDLTIKNYKGINLPETGGMGTKIFMIGGAVLLIGAATMLIVYTKKQKKA